MGSTLWWGLALTAVLVVAIYWLSAPKPRKSLKNVEGLRRELERLTHDPAAADRLVARMRQRHPDASTARLYQLAIDELLSDRR